MAEARALGIELRRLIEQTNIEHPAKKDTQALQTLLTGHPELWREVDNFAQQNINQLLNQAKMTVASRELTTTGLEEMRKDLGYTQATILEQGLIEQVLLCWLRLNLWEYYYTVITYKGGLSLEAGLFWEKRISSAQHRYFRACLTLAKIRRLGIQVQVNIATDGGQQINVIKE